MIQDLFATAIAASAGDELNALAREETVTLKMGVGVLLSILAGPAVAACEFEVEVGDSLQYNVAEMTADKSCELIKVTIKHTGNLPAIAMGHNWVLSRAGDLSGIAADGISAGIDNNYVKPDDDRVFAATKIVGGGESDTIEFSTSTLNGDEFVFFCSFPGHSSIMKGTFKLV